ncbi:hypothetical protein R1flu_026125 [Riccia fluitans]|uniref:Cytochrome c oxidase subunit 1 n=1 Tax=Riccia fluitans TaxID=41844 RepID=A0ABD1XF25_9MARC
MPAGQGMNTTPPVMYASAPGQGSVFYFTPTKTTKIPGTIVPSVLLVPTSGIGRPTFAFGAGPSRPGMNTFGATGGPTPMPSLFPILPVHNRPAPRSVKRWAVVSPPRPSQPGASPFMSIPNPVRGPTPPSYNPWQNVYPGKGIPRTSLPGLPSVPPVGGFPARSYPMALSPMPVLNGVMSGGYGLTP